MSTDGLINGQFVYEWHLCVDGYPTFVDGWHICVNRKPTFVDRWPTFVDGWQKMCQKMAYICR